MRSALWIVPLASLVATSALAQPRRGGPPSTPDRAFAFEYVGPPSAGRIAAIAGVPGNPQVYYAGAASGGVWKTVDGGDTFAPIFDDQPVQAIGTLAVAPSDTAVVWAGTGEAWAIRDADVIGDGVYRSTDGGATWKHMGLDQTGRIGRIVIHPTDPNTVYVCALGRATGPQQERGVYRTTDGGTTWARVLFVDPNTGCSGLAMDARDPKVLFAGMWQLEMHTWAMKSGGPGSGVYKSTDGGTTWTRLTNGLPKSPVGKIDVAVAPSDSKRVYALVETPNQGSLWRSDDGGAAWRVVSWDRTLIGRAGYYIRLGINPKNPDEVLVATSSFHRSTDGGHTFTLIGGCGDCHDVWIDPTNPDRWAETGDGGMGITTNHGRSFTQMTLPIGQMYHVAIDGRVPYWIYSNRQDDGTMRGPTNAPVPVNNVPSYHLRGYGEGEWESGLGGCESGFTIPDPTDPNIVWATCYGAKVTRYDDRVKLARSVEPWRHTLDSPPTEVRYRCHWTPPLAIDPFDHTTVYMGCQVVLATSNGGQTWRPISPDLSTRDSSRIVSSGGLIGDNLGQFYGEVVFAIAPSPIARGLIWAGTNDGKIWYTTDGGGTWNDVTKNVTGLPVWGTIRQITPSAFDSATAYVAVDFHMMDDRTPYIYKTTDLGRTWTRINGDLPADHPLSYVMTIAENPNRKGMLFAGTGHGFYYSLDDGGHWTQFKEGLPAAPVSWIVVSKPFHDVVVSTYGRGLWVLRDVAALEQPAPDSTDAVHLYAPAPGVRQARRGYATFTFTLAKAPTDSVKVDVLDASGGVLRHLSTVGHVGLNRVAWDLRYEAPKQPMLRALPPDNPHIWEEPRFKGDSTRPVTHWGIQGAQRTGPIGSPGSYTVRVTANGVSRTASFPILRDSTMPSPDADLAASTAMQVRIRDDMDTTVAMINRLEVMRKELQDLLAANAGNRSLAQPLGDLERKMFLVETQLLSREALHSDDKWFPETNKVYLDLVWLSGEVGSGAGDVAGGAEYKPTDAEVGVLQGIEQRLAAAAAAYTTLMSQDVPAFNRQMAGKLPAIAAK